MPGETLDISQFSELASSDCEKYRDDTSAYPDEIFAVGKYLGTSIYAGPATRAKILIQDEEVLHSSTYRPLTQEELDSDDEEQKKKSFLEHVHQRLGAQVKAKDLHQIGADETPSYYPYEDAEQKALTFPPLDEEDTTSYA